MCLASRLEEKCDQRARFSISSFRPYAIDNAVSSIRVDGLLCSISDSAICARLVTFKRQYVYPRDLVRFIIFQMQGRESGERFCQWPALLHNWIMQGILRAWIHRAELPELRFRTKLFWGIILSETIFSYQVWLVVITGYLFSLFKWNVNCSDKLPIR